MALAVIILCLLWMANINILEGIVFFILTGNIAFINLTIPPVIMLIFWILLVPVSVLIYKIGGQTIWAAIETIGKINQRRINRAHRWIAHQVPSKTTVTPLVVITMVYISSNLPPKTTNPPVIYSRRRLVSAGLKL